MWYTTAPIECVYFPDVVERKLFTPITSPEQADSLLISGCRRTGAHMYKQMCPSCQKCKSMRLVVDDFIPDRTMRKTMKRNADIVMERGPAFASKELFELFSRYEKSRHATSSMAKMTWLDFEEWWEGSPIDTFVYEYRLNGVLIGVSLNDQLRDGVSGVYKFFDPDLDKRSLGTYIILSTIEEMRKQGLKYFYLGWNNGSDTMAYKTRFRPYENFDGTKWIREE